MPPGIAVTGILSDYLVKHALLHHWPGSLGRLKALSPDGLNNFSYGCGSDIKPIRLPFAWQRVVQNPCHPRQYSLSTGPNYQGAGARPPGTIIQPGWNLLFETDAP